MKIFFIWPYKNPEISILFSELEKNSHQILYWAGLKEGEKYKPDGAIFHDHFEALAGRPAQGVDTSDFMPPDEDLIAKLYQAESQILTMMNKRYYNMSLDERKHLYYEMLRYWQGIIDKLKPEVIIFPNIPHTVYNYLIYELARMRGIKTLMFEDTQIGNRLLLLEDWQESCERLKMELEKNRGKIFNVEDLKVDLQEYYKLQSDLKKDATPYYMKHYKNQATGKKFLYHKYKIIIAAIKNGTIFKRIADYAGKLKINPQKEYRGLQKKADLTKKFIYLPLHFQPERTTSPMGGAYVDQILMIETLAAALPRDWAIYVKEHPSQLWLNGLNYSSCRYPGYYEKISRLNNVYLISPETNSYELIKYCQALATVTGTAGWEAVLRLKPVIVFGYAWYRDCPGVFKVDGAASCRQALGKISGGFSLMEQNIINYLKCLDDAAIVSKIDRNIGNIKIKTDLSDSEIMTSIAKTIINEIK